MFSRSGARLDANVYVGPRCHLGLVHLERDVLLGAGVHVPSGGATHGTDDGPADSGTARRRTLVRIGEGTWVGSRRDRDGRRRQALGHRRGRRRDRDRCPTTRSPPAFPRESSGPDGRHRQARRAAVQCGDSRVREACERSLSDPSTPVRSESRRSHSRVSPDARDVAVRARVALLVRA